MKKILTCFFVVLAQTIFSQTSGTLSDFKVTYHEKSYSSDEQGYNFSCYLTLNGSFSLDEFSYKLALISSSGDTIYSKNKEFEMFSSGRKEYLSFGTISATELKKYYSGNSGSVTTYIQLRTREATPRKITAKNTFAFTLPERPKPLSVSIDSISFGSLNHSHYYNEMMVNFEPWVTLKVSGEGEFKYELQVTTVRGDILLKPKSYSKFSDLNESTHLRESISYKTIKSFCRPDDKEIEVSISVYYTGDPSVRAEHTKRFPFTMPGPSLPTKLTIESAEVNYTTFHSDKNKTALVINTYVYLERKGDPDDQKFMVQGGFVSADGDSIFTSTPNENYFLYSEPGLVKKDRVEITPMYLHEVAPKVRGWGDSLRFWMKVYPQAEPEAFVTAQKNVFVQIPKFPVPAKMLPSCMGMRIVNNTRDNYDGSFGLTAVLDLRETEGWKKLYAQLEELNFDNFSFRFIMTDNSGHSANHNQSAMTREYMKQNNIYKYFIPYSRFYLPEGTHAMQAYLVLTDSRGNVVSDSLPLGKADLLIPPQYDISVSIKWLKSPFTECGGSGRTLNINAGEQNSSRDMDNRTPAGIVGTTDELNVQGFAGERISIGIYDDHKRRRFIFFRRWESHTHFEDTLLLPSKEGNFSGKLKKDGKVYAEYTGHLTQLYSAQKFSASGSMNRFFGNRTGMLISVNGTLPESSNACGHDLVLHFAGKENENNFSSSRVFYLASLSDSTRTTIIKSSSVSDICVDDKKQFSKYIFLPYENIPAGATDVEVQFFDPTSIRHLSASVRVALPEMPSAKEPPHCSKPRITDTLMNGVTGKMAEWLVDVPFIHHKNYMAIVTAEAPGGRMLYPVAETKKLASAEPGFEKIRVRVFAGAHDALGPCLARLFIIDQKDTLLAEDTYLNFDGSKLEPIRLLMTGPKKEKQWKKLSIYSRYQLQVTAGTAMAEINLDHFFSHPAGFADFLVSPGDSLRFTLLRSEYSGNTVTYIPVSEWYGVAARGTEILFTGKTDETKRLLEAVHFRIISREEEQKLVKNEKTVRFLPSFAGAKRKK